MTIPRITLAIGGEPVLVDRAVLAVSTAVRRADASAQRTVILAGSDDAAHQLQGGGRAQPVR